MLAIGGQQELGGPAVLIGGEFAFSPGGDSYLGRWKACGLGALLSVPVCMDNPLQLKALSPGLVQGQVAHFVSSGKQGEGVSVLLAGMPAVAANGCGVPVAGLGEVLLSMSPGPFPVGTTPTVNGAAAFRVPVPVRPALVGLEVGFPSAHVPTSLPGLPATLSNALLGRLLPKGLVRPGVRPGPFGTIRQLHCSHLSLPTLGEAPSGDPCPRPRHTAGASGAAPPRRSHGVAPRPAAAPVVAQMGGGFCPYSVPAGTAAATVAEMWRLA